MIQTEKKTVNMISRNIGKKLNTACKKVTSHITDYPVELARPEPNYQLMSKPLCINKTAFRNGNARPRTL